MFRLAARFLLSSLLLTTLTAFAADAPKKRAISLDDLARLVRVGAPVISPDGDWVLFTASQIDVKDDKNVTHLWMAKWDGSVQLQLTFGKDGVSLPRFSPDGRYISFLSSRPGPAKGAQIWLMDRRGGEAQQLTAITDQELEGYLWSPDSKRLLLTLHPKAEPDAPEGKDEKPAAPKPIVIDRYHFKQDIVGYLRNDDFSALYLYDLATKKPEKLTNSKNVNEEEAAWSPDGAWIAFVSNADSDPDRTNNTDVFVVSPSAASTPRKLTTWPGHDGGHLAWSPDAKSIAYVQGLASDLEEYEQSKPAVVTLDGKVTYPAATFDRAMGSPQFSPDGKLSYLVADDRSEYPAEVELAGNSAKRLLAQSGKVFAWDTKAGHVALLYSNDTSPAELYALENGSLRKLTAQNDALVAELNLVPTEDISFTDSDGVEVHGLLTRPADFKAGQPVPLFLYIHGGPNGEDEHSFDFLRQWMAANGYAELNINYQGGAGRGQAYASSIFADWGNKEVKDLLAGVDKTVAMGVADPARLTIGGWSYGGILTDYTTASDNRFKAAISGAGNASPLSFYGSDQYILQYEFELGAPWKNPKLYQKLSYPLLEADKRMHTPTLYMGGTADFNVPIEGSEQMYQALKSLGIPTELVVYPDQFHGFTRPSYIRDRYVRWLAWLDKYTKPAAAVPETKK
jgi:dipeptidyl aminopeptidase/acylaminoacyl peptidase